MALALIVAPSDPRAGDAASRRGDLAWLRGRLAALKFDVVIVGAGQDASVAVEKAAPMIAEGAAVFVHVSGRLRGDDTLVFGGSTLRSSMPLGFLTTTFAARRPATLAVVGELTYDDGDERLPGFDARVRLSRAIEGFAVERHGFSLLASVRALHEGASRMAFTRAIWPGADEVAPFGDAVGLVMAMHERATASREFHGDTMAFAFVAGKAVARPGAETAAEGHLPRATAGAQFFAGLAESLPLSVPLAEPPSTAEAQPPSVVVADELHSASAEVPPREPADSLPSLPSSDVLPSLPSSDVLPSLPSSDVLPSWSSSDLSPAAASVDSPAGTSTESARRREQVDARIAAAAAARDWDAVVMLRRDVVASLGRAPEKVQQLGAIAQILQSELGDERGAIEALEVARELEPERASTLRALRASYERQRRWASAIEVLGALAEIAGSPNDRASHRVDQARIALDRMDDPVTATSALQRALDDDPTNGEALALLLAIRRAEGGADETRPPTPPAREVTGVAERGGHLVDSPLDGSAQISYDAAPGRLPQDASPVDSLATPTSLEGIEASAARAPLHAPFYVEAFAIHRREGQTDRALLAAMALEELGSADLEQQHLIDQFRSVAPVRARAPLDDAAWERLRAPGYDDVLAALFVSLQSAAIATKLDELRVARRARPLDRSERLSETSTASAVRSFHWAARFLGIACPDLYASDECAGIASWPAADPSIALGPSVLSGRSVKDLAFLAARQLTYYRPEYHVLLYYPTRQELTELLFAAVQLTMPDSVSLAAAPGVRALRGRLAAQIGLSSRSALVEAVGALNARGGQAKVGAWMRAAELTAARAGLLLSGDLATAAALVRSEANVVGDLSVDERRGDLVAFCASTVHNWLRARFVAVTPESGAPPPSDAPPRTLAAS